MLYMAPEILKDERYNTSFYFIYLFADILFPVMYGHLELFSIRYL
jgi:hypothetical protein